jgi:hypothetical protein
MLLVCGRSAKEASVLRTIVSTSVLVVSVLATISSVSAATQQRRMDDYESALRAQIEQRLEEFRLALRDGEASGEPVPYAAARARARVEESRTDNARLRTPNSNAFGSVVNVYESKDGNGQDVEIRLTMPIDAFMEFAPIAALEAASIPHKFPVVYIFIREETTDRVARVAFRDAEPIAGRYLAGDRRAVDEMKAALIWH